MKSVKRTRSAQFHAKAEGHVREESDSSFRRNNVAFEKRRMTGQCSGGMSDCEPRARPALQRESRLPPPLGG